VGFFSTKSNSHGEELEQQEKSKKKKKMEEWLQERPHGASINIERSSTSFFL
jgi:hypothetical protein